MLTLDCQSSKLPTCSHEGISLVLLICRGKKIPTSNMALKHQHKTTTMATNDTRMGEPVKP